jgi:hypothetical protein
MRFTLTTLAVSTIVAAGVLGAPAFAASSKSTHNADITVGADGADSLAFGSATGTGSASTSEMPDAVTTNAGSGTSLFTTFVSGNYGSAWGSASGSGTSSASVKGFDSPNGHSKTETSGHTGGWASGSGSAGGSVTNTSNASTTSGPSGVSTSAATTGTVTASASGGMGGSGASMSSSAGSASAHTH